MKNYHYNDFNDCLRAHCPKCNKPTTIFEVSGKYDETPHHVLTCKNCQSKFIVEVYGRFEFCFEKAEISEVRP